MAINPGMAGMAPPQGAGMGAGGQQAQLVQQLRQMDHEQLVMLTMQLIMRLRQLEGAAQQAGGQMQPPMR